MTIEKVLQYINKYEMFTIVSIDTIDDTKNIKINTTKTPFYFNVKNKRVHNGYPMNLDNIVSDLQNEFVIHKMHKFNN